MKLLVLSPIDKAAIARLAVNHDVISAVGASEKEILRLAADREVLIFRSGVNISAALIASAPNLELLVRAGSGFDNVDMEQVALRGIRFVRIPQPGARAVAELTFGLMLALARGLLPADRAWRQGRWVKNEVTGFLLRDKVLGILGCGSIGTEVGVLGTAWGMHVIGCVRHPTPAISGALRGRGIQLTDCDDVVRTADFLSIHVSLNDSTRSFVNADVLSRMKKGSFLLNLARGGVVDEIALRSELLSGQRVRGAALDVHAEEGNGKISGLADLPNVILTPHIGSTTVDTQREIGERVLEIIQSHAAERRQALHALAR